MKARCSSGGIIRDIRFTSVIKVWHRLLSPFPPRRGAWAYWTPYYYIYIYTYTWRTSNPTTEQLDTIPLSSVQGFKEVAQPWYTDQILPFDITIAAANEYGAAASAKLYGVEILNEGFGTSVDDSVLEQQATFIARSISPLQAIGRLSERSEEDGRSTRGDRCRSRNRPRARAGQPNTAPGRTWAS